MKIVWSNGAKKAFSKIDERYQRRIEVKLTELDDRSAPRPDNHGYVLAVKRRTSTTYLHEESATYGCTANQG
ncbi:type II toxin-antitoxin system RelE/ParE family toxin [Enterobacter cloacae]|uniref:type II toxin-antitoxin system RelE family toxin n=1 Tax=Enterobacter cloacae complex TaxID=354276 RepID=UPI00210EFB68|nr:MULTISPECIES: type II toxin-antitoxin system RelE/ParE family toxin [Enterobacter cloacae complex]MCQ4445899.1 type II toxin-antitoxin system RelE/ParE family toxin [Enterobacter cloacae]MDW2869069.1 type II toxin-antitoxin system RelE/ParE family toxin [Enterobacter hormaechei]